MSNILIASKCSLLALLALVGCASKQRVEPVEIPPAPPETTYTVVAHSGRVVSRIALPASKDASSTRQIPLFLGRIAVPMTVTQSGRELLAGYYIYEIALVESMDRRVRVASRGDIPDGTCVDVMAREVDQGRTSYPNGEAALRASEVCK